MAAAPVTDDEIVEHVRRYLSDYGLDSDGEVTPDSSLAELGLDSIGVAELLLGARAELVGAGRIPPEATLLELPPVQTVADLGDLLRSLVG